MERKEGNIGKELASKSAGLDVEKTKESGLSSKQIEANDSLKSKMMEGRLRRFLQSARCTFVIQTEIDRPSEVRFCHDKNILRSRILKRQIMENTDENRSRVILIRLKPNEYKLLEKRFQKSMFQYMSEYSRNVLLQKPVIFTYRDKSMDDMLEELIKLRRELNYIGNNFNQAVHKLNSVIGMPDAKLWQEALTVLRDQLEPSMREIKDKLNNYSEIWSQKS